MDTRTILENNISKLDGTDFASVQGNPTKNRVGYVGRIMNACIEREDLIAAKQDRPRENLFLKRSKEDPFHPCRIQSMMNRKMMSARSWNKCYRKRPKVAY